MINSNIVGNLGRDAELRYTPSGTAVCNLAVACSYGMKDQATGEKPTQWMEIAVWGKQAEALAPYLLKGTKIAASVKDTHTDIYNKPDGTPVPKMKATLVEIEFMSPAQGQGQQQANPYGQQPMQQPQGQYQQQPQQQYQQQMQQQAATPPPGYIAPQQQQQYQQQPQNNFDNDSSIPF